MKHITKLVGLVLVALLALTGCVVNQTNTSEEAAAGGADGDGGGGGGGDGGPKVCVPEMPKDGKPAFALVSHSAPGDPFWDVVKTGAEKAAKQMGATVSYAGSASPTEQSQLIENAVAQDVDGLIVSMANPDGVKNAVEAAVKACVPVITINSGLEQSKQFGAITHVGQSERIAGEAAGEKLNDLGASNVICVIHEAGNVSLEDRCAGVAETFEGDVENVQVDVSNVAEAQSTMRSKLADTSIDGVLTLNPAVADAAVLAADEAGSDAVLATFDISSNVLKALKNGTMAFAIDQQPYVQGYLPVVLLWLKLANGNDVGGGQPVLSGPSFVTKENAAQVEGFAAKGTR